MDPTQQDPNAGSAGVPPVMDQTSPIAQAMSVMLTKMIEQIMQQFMAKQQMTAQSAMGQVGGQSAQPSAMPPPGAGGPPGG